MNSETEHLQNGRPQPSLEELEKKYFKNNELYYTNKEPETNFEKFEFSEKDLESLKNLRGDHIEENENADPEEGLAGHIEDNPVDMSQLRKDMDTSTLAYMRKKLFTKSTLIYLCLFLNFFIPVAANISMIWGLSVSLVTTALTHYAYFVLIVSAWVQSPENLLLMEERIIQNKGWLLKIDLCVMLWAPCKGILLNLIFPHQDWSPLAPYAADNFSILITVAMAANFCLLRRIDG